MKIVIAPGILLNRERVIRSCENVCYNISYMCHKYAILNTVDFSAIQIYNRLWINLCTHKMTLKLLSVPSEQPCPLRTGAVFCFLSTAYLASTGFAYANPWFWTVSRRREPVKIRLQGESTLTPFWYKNKLLLTRHRFLKILYIYTEKGLLNGKKDKKTFPHPVPERWWKIYPWHKI